MPGRSHSCVRAEGDRARCACPVDNAMSPRSIPKAVDLGEIGNVQRRTHGVAEPKSGRWRPTPECGPSTPLPRGAWPQTSQPWRGRHRKGALTIVPKKSPAFAGPCLWLSRKRVPLRGGMVVEHDEEMVRGPGFLARSAIYAKVRQKSSYAGIDWTRVPSRRSDTHDSRLRREWEWTAPHRVISRARMR